ncbi:fimbrial biogenesis chaperone [Pseudomonas sp. OTU5201]|uniref:fimbrial biogenesis chaperone n=1 Tax=Pseudomonas sp. OTU5201 TaxID=3043850 RepID=UPI00313E4006
MFRIPSLPRLLLVLAVILSGPAAEAALVITGTRVIYPGEQQEVTVQLKNNSQTPVLAQAWVDDGDENSSAAKAKSPFLLAPPVFRVNPQKGQSVRLRLLAKDLPQDRESLYWFNVLELPPKPDSAEVDGRNMLQLAFRTRIKLFYRPAGLRGADEAPQQIRWRLADAGDGKGQALEGHNPSKFHISFSEVALAGQSRTAVGSGMLAPGETRQFPLPAGAPRPPADAKVEFSVINDFGGAVPVILPLGR